jgi:hypothetical protein
MGTLGNGRQVGQVSDYMGNDLPRDLVKCLILGARSFKLYYEQPICFLPAFNIFRTRLILIVGGTKNAKPNKGDQAATR